MNKKYYIISLGCWFRHFHLFTKYMYNVPYMKNNFLPDRNIIVKSEGHNMIENKY